MNNKILKIILIVLPLLAILIVFLFFYFNKEKDIEPTTYYPIEEAGLQIGDATEEEIDFDGVATSNEDNKNKEGENILSKKIDKAQIINDTIYFYAQEDKTFNKIGINNEKYKITVLISNLPVITDMQVNFSEKYLLYQEASNGDYYVYDFEEKRKTEINQFVESAIWSPQNDEVLFGSYSNINKNNINLYYWKEDRREEIVNLLITNGVLFDVSLDSNYLLYSRNETWIPEEEIITSEAEPEKTLDNKLVVFDLKEKKELLQKEIINNAKFNSSGNKILFSKLSSSEYPSITLMDIKTQKKIYLNLGTYFNKIEFSNDSNILVYAKVENYKGAYTKDTLWKVNLLDGKKTQLTELSPNINYDISNIMISSDNKKIYFINRYDQKLYQVNIE